MLHTPRIGIQIGPDDPCFTSRLGLYDAAHMLGRCLDERLAGGTVLIVGGLMSGEDNGQDIVGKSGVVFPAIKSGVDLSLATRKANGLDVSAFTDQALDPQGTFLFPITDHGAEISTIMDPVMQSIMLGQSKAADALKDANTKVNATFQ